MASSHHYTSQQQNRAPAQAPAHAPRSRLGNHAQEHVSHHTAPIHYHYAAPDHTRSYNGNATGIYGIWISMLFQLALIGGVLYWCVPSFRQRITRMLAWWAYWGRVEPPPVPVLDPNHVRPRPPDAALHVFGEAVARDLREAAERRQAVFRRMNQNDQERIDEPVGVNE